MPQHRGRFHIIMSSVVLKVVGSNDGHLLLCTATGPIAIVLAQPAGPSQHWMIQEWPISLSLRTTPMYLHEVRDRKRDRSYGLRF
jgi:hypothetical protein